MIAVTGATGHLGRLVVEGLLRTVPSRELVARAARGGRRRGPARPARSPAPRLHEHPARHDVEARPGGEHAATERAIRASGLPFVFLRNGWYIENYTEHLGPALQHGAIVGSAGEGRIAAATRADYAEAAVAVLTGAGHENATYELAGDRPFTMAELAAEASRRAGRTIAYRDLPPDQYKAVLTGAGVPGPYADLLVDSDLGVAKGELDDATGDLRRLIGRPTTPLSEAVAAAI